MRSVGVGTGGGGVTTLQEMSVWFLGQTEFESARHTPKSDIRQAVEDAKYLLSLTGPKGLDPPAALVPAFCVLLEHMRTFHYAPDHVTGAIDLILTNLRESEPPDATET